MTLRKRIALLLLCALIFSTQSLLASTFYKGIDQAQRFQITLPQWVHKSLQNTAHTMPSLQERMHLVNTLARRNFQEGTGGPFAAAVFERDTGKLIAVGVNRVMPSGCSSAHAEIVCLSLAQQTLGSYDLGGEDMPAYQLVVNWRPCTMCYGATLWSGIRSLVIPGSGPELENITGFDEDPMHPDWKSELRRRGIKLIEGIGRIEAIAVFEDFAASGSTVYNGRQGENR